MSYFSPPYKYMSGNELSELIKSNKKAHKDYLVIDVRDDDYIGGNIRNCLNSPSESFVDQVHYLVQKTKHIPTVIFHCALSQQRGPKAARIYAETRDSLDVEGQDKLHEVYVLRGGFTEFQSRYKDDPELIENFDKSIWNNSYF